MTWYFDIPAWWRARKVAAAMRRTPLASIADAPEGVVIRVVGTIVPGPTLDAPLSGRPCVHYRAEAQDVAVITSDAVFDGGGRRTAAHETASVPFAIDDGTARALIDPAGAELAVRFDLVERQRTLGDPTPRQLALLARHRMAGNRIHPHTFCEGVLAIGARVAVCGLAVREPDPDGAARATGYRDAPTRLRFATSAKAPLWINRA